jgi:hypothetical protein
MGRNDELMEALAKLRKAEKDVVDYRIEVANLLKQAVDSQQSVSDLHRLTEINRTTIYWLINTWSTSSGNSR